MAHGTVALPAPPSQQQQQTQHHHTQLMLAGSQLAGVRQHTHTHSKFFSEKDSTSLGNDYSESIRVQNRTVYNILYYTSVDFSCVKLKLLWKNGIHEAECITSFVLNYI